MGVGFDCLGVLVGVLGAAFDRSGVFVGGGGFVGFEMGVLVRFEMGVLGVPMGDGKPTGDDRLDWLRDGVTIDSPPIINKLIITMRIKQPVPVWFVSFGREILCRLTPIYFIYLSFIFIYHNRINSDRKICGFGSSHRT